MTDLEKHNLAISKLRTKLFEKHHPEEYGIVLGSEQIIPWRQSRLIGSKPNLGGLSYSLAHPKYHRVDIDHFRGNLFNIHVFGKSNDKSLDVTFHASEVEFDKLPEALMKVLKES